MQELIAKIQALREDLGLMEGALAGSPASAALAFAEFGADGAVVSLSPAAALRLGVDPQAAIGRPIGALVDVQGEGDLVQCFLGSGAAIPALRIRESKDGAGVLVFGTVGGTLATEMRRAPEKFLHDIANVLGVIRGHTELLAMELEDARVASATNEILEAVSRAQELLQEQRGK
ncbi:MAG TPA: hypothetical protein VLA56_20250 [Pseudomonadales bacterium]|nr:hypothetical protein [Pseudomonadales bacterium]